MKNKIQGKKPMKNWYVPCHPKNKKKIFQSIQNLSKMKSREKKHTKDYFPYYPKT